jgi:hypothetical protein
MWGKLLKALRQFPDVVLMWSDEEGYPVGGRIRPEPDRTTQLLRVTPPRSLKLQSGPASMLAHSHNEETWQLKSFVARGRLEQDEAGWVFQPLTFVPGAGVGSLTDQLRPLLTTRATAKRYLARRGLSRPPVAWDRIKDSY